MEVTGQHPVTVCFFFLLVLLRGRLTDMGAGTPFPAAVIADPKIICQPDGGFPAWQSKQPGHKINHIAVRPAPETVEAAVYLHAGGSVAWNGQQTMPFLRTLIPYSSAACLVVTFSLTASNTFITSSFPGTKKAPDRFK